MHPLSYLSGSGEQTSWVLPLMWFTLSLSIVVVLVISAMVLWAVLSRSFGSGARTMAQVPIERSEGGVRWIWTGVAVSTVFLLISVFWTVGVLAKIGRATPAPPLIINVTAHQWWWDAVYSGTTESRALPHRERNPHTRRTAR